MKKIFASTLLLFLIMMTNLTYGNDRHTEDKPADYSLVLVRNFPHLMPMIFNNAEKLKISETQKDALMDIIADVKEPFFSKAGEAMMLEKELSVEILRNGKTKDDVKEKIVRLIETKSAVAYIYFDAMNRIKGILTDEQYKDVLNMAFKN